MTHRCEFLGSKFLEKFLGVCYLFVPETTANFILEVDRSRVNWRNKSSTKIVVTDGGIRNWWLIYHIG